MRRLPTILLSVGASLLGLAATAQPYTTDPTRLGPALVDGEVPVIEPRGMALYDPMGLSNALQPVITIEHRGNLGYDVRYEFRNTFLSPRPIGRLDVGILALGERVRIYDHASTSSWRDLEYGTFQGTGWLYPGHAYSPVMVAMNQTHVVGVSLLYPVMEYRHDAVVRMHRVGGVFGGPAASRGWMVTFDLNDGPGATQYTRVSQGAVLQPGETRSYTVAVRAMKRPDMSGSVTGPQEWLGVLEPYRTHFQSQFGGVNYERRTKPILAWELAGGYQVNSQNRRGFGGGTERPDRVGFAPVANRIAQTNIGYDSVMLWAPSGVFDVNQHLNFPARFTAGWLDQEKLRTATDSIGLPAIPRSGKEMGLWWGRAAEHMDRWNDDASERLDPSNPEHMGLVHLQLDLARRAGATMIGLDAFTHATMSVWDQVPYLTHLRQRYPEMSFITEEMSSDVVHRIAPSFTRGYQSGPGMNREEHFHRLSLPHYLADYLLPGHETWGYFRYSEIQYVAGQRIDAARLQRDVERLARRGYVPVVASALALSTPSRATADRTWLHTVPASAESANGGSNGGGNGDGTGGDTGDDSADSGTDTPPGDGGETEVVQTPTPPPAEDVTTETKPGEESEPRRVRYITLPDGRRIRILGK